MVLNQGQYDPSGAIWQRLETHSPIIVRVLFSASGRRKLKVLLQPHSAQNSSAKKKKVLSGSKCQLWQGWKLWFRLGVSNHVAQGEGEIEELFALVPEAPKAPIPAAQKAV